MKADITITYTFTLNEDELAELELDQSQGAAPLTDQIQEYVEGNAEDLISEQGANMEVTVDTGDKKKPKPEKTD